MAFANIAVLILFQSLELNMNSNCIKSNSNRLSLHVITSIDYIFRKWIGKDVVLQRLELVKRTCVPQGDRSNNSSKHAVDLTLMSLHSVYWQSFAQSILIRMFGWIRIWMAGPQRSAAALSHELM